MSYNTGLADGLQCKNYENTAVVCPAAGGAKPPKSAFLLLLLR